MGNADCPILDGKLNAESLSDFPGVTHQIGRDGPVTDFQIQYCFTRQMLLHSVVIFEKYHFHVVFYSFQRASHTLYIH